MNLYKYTRMAKVQVGVEIVSVIDLVLVKKDVLHSAQDVRAVRRMELGLSGNHVVVGVWVGRSVD